jgi:hypothetical protein
MTNVPMTCRRERWLLLAASLAVLSTGRLAPGQVRTDDRRPPTPIEQALGDHACRSGASSVSIRVQSYQDCLGSELLGLRSAFGHDLARLTAAERKTVDSRCAPLQASGPDGYVACLSRELEPLRLRRGRLVAQAAPQAHAAPAASLVAALEASADVVPEPPPVPVDAPLGVPSRVWTGAAVAFAGLALVACLVRVRARQPAARCRGCGAALPAAGDLCPPCRHGAAESLRRSAAESPPRGVPVGAAGYPDDSEPVRDSGASEQATTGADNVQWPMHPFQSTVETVEAAAPASGVDWTPSVHDRSPVDVPAAIPPWSPEDQARARPEDPEPHASDPRAATEAFDPFGVLGVPRGAPPCEIEEAYQAARRRYDPGEVAHLGAELRDHFREKAEAVERAYEQLSLGKTA